MNLKSDKIYTTELYVAKCIDEVALYAFLLK
jgi:hypothetical protein